jgi:hypothetical protein
MKTFATLILAITLLSCSKQQSVNYSASCDRCHVWYQATDTHERSVAVVGVWNRFVVDTVITLADTTYTMDSTLTPGTWSFSVDLEGDASPYIKARNEHGSTVTAISMNGETASTTSYMGIVRLH